MAVDDALRVFLRDRDGLLHCEDGPAVIAGGYREWWWHGAPQRLDGPAMEDLDGVVPPQWHLRERAATVTGAENEHDMSREPVPGEVVARLWLREHHPDASDAVRRLLLDLLDPWPVGTTLADLWTAAVVATTA